MRRSLALPHSLVGAYALDALDAADLSRFERHLARCSECADEVAGLREVAGRLAAASAGRPPAGLRARLLARTPMIRQVPPTVANPQAGSRRYLPWPRRSGSWPERLRRPAPAPVLAAALALCIAVAAVAVAVTGLTPQRGLATLPAPLCYELWLMGANADRPAGLLPVPSHDMTGPVIVRGLHRGDHLGLTVEPASGSRRPTSAMILVLTL